MYIGYRDTGSVISVGAIESTWTIFTKWDNLLLIRNWDLGIPVHLQGERFNVTTWIYGEHCITRIVQLWDNLFINIELGPGSSHYFSWRY